MFGGVGELSELPFVYIYTYMASKLPHRSMRQRLGTHAVWCGTLAACAVASCGGQVVENGTLPDTPSQERSASLHGTVTDQGGRLLPGARVEITLESESFTEIADSEGEFRANGLRAGTYTIRALDSGFISVEERVTVLQGEVKEVAPIPLRMATSRAEVTVVATVHEIAVAQVAAEEKQRVLGIIPNFYVVYDKEPAPLAVEQKFHLAWRSIFDPISLLGVGVAAGIGQATNQYGGYGQGAQGYAKRYGAAFADGAVSGFLGGAILPVLFKQDPRYYYQGTGTVWSRTKHAVASVVVTHGNNGKRQFNYSNVLGTFGAAGISNAYYPASDRHGAGLTMQNAAVGLAFGAFGSVMQEFVVRKLTPHLPSREHPATP
jgi:hypothetical protein